MSDDMVYNLLSRYSLLKMLWHAIGKGGVLGERVIMSKVVNFLTYTAEYDCPTVIRSEIERAKKMGLIDVDFSKMVSLTDEGRKEMEKYGIVDGMNPLWNEALEHKKRGQHKLYTLKMEQASDNGLFWKPEEWRGGAVVKKEKIIPTYKKDGIKVGSIEVTKKPRKPKKLN